MPTRQTSGHWNYLTSPSRVLPGNLNSLRSRGPVSYGWIFLWGIISTDKRNNSGKNIFFPSIILPRLPNSERFRTNSILFLSPSFAKASAGHSRPCRARFIGAAVRAPRFRSFFCARDFSLAFSGMFSLPLPAGRPPNPEFIPMNIGADNKDILLPFVLNSKYD